MSPMNYRNRITLSAKNGDAKSQYILARLYNHGLYGLKKNYTKAMKWYKKSAEQGYVKAKNHIKYNNYNLFNTRHEDKETVKWLTILSDQGNIDAQWKLALIYYHGKKGVQQDYIKAMKYIKSVNDNSNNKEYKFAQEYVDIILKDARESDNDLLIELLTIIDQDHYKLEIRSLEKQL